jgi:hypothetical protein
MVFSLKEQWQQPEVFLCLTEAVLIEPNSFGDNVYLEPVELLNTEPFPRYLSMIFEQQVFYIQRWIHRPGS